MNENEQLKSYKAILRDRAKTLAMETVEEVVNVGTSFLLFALGKEEKYAIAYQYIERVTSLEKLTHIPNVPSLLLGVTYYNAEVWPVVDSEKLLGFSHQDKLTPEYIVLMRRGSYHYGLTIRYPIGPMRYDVNVKLEQVTSEQHEKKNFIKGVYSPDIMVLDDDAIFKYMDNLVI